MAKKSSRPTAIPSRELAIFCRQMSLIIGSDITIQQGLEMLLAQADQGGLRLALEAVVESMNNGLSFGASFAEQQGAFPEYLTSMVSVGEQSGMLDVVFSQMADYYEKEHRVQRKVSSALTYPSILTALMLGVIALLVLRIMPMFEQILVSMGGNMPALTKAMMGFSGLLVDNILIIAIAAAALIIGYILYRSTKWGRIQSSRNQLRSPITGSVRRRVLTARFARSIGILLKSGVSILSALDSMDALMGNEYAAGKIRLIKDSIQDGAGLTETLKESGLFPSLFLRLIQVGESTGNIDEMMLKSASIYDEEVDDALEKLTTAIEPFLIIVLSVIVGFILLSVMLPMIEIMANIK